MSLMDICHRQIYDRVIDGKEYQLIKRKNLIKSFLDLGVKLSIPEQTVLKDILQPTFQDFTDINVLQQFLTDLGITEDIPKPTKHLDFSHLEPSDIRMLNKIIKYMEAHKIQDVLDLMGNQNININ